MDGRKKKCDIRCVVKWTVGSRNVTLGVLLNGR